MRRVRREIVGLGTSDCLAFAALVLAAGGSCNSASAFVRDLVLQAGAVAGTATGADARHRLRLVAGVRLGARCAVVGVTLGAGAGTVGDAATMDRVMR